MAEARRSVRIGSGSAGSGDRVEPAIALADSGLVRWMGFDTLAERTLALAQIRRRQDPAAGYDEQLARIASGLAPFVAGGGRVVGSFGAANPPAALGVVVDALRAAGVRGVTVAAVHGDDIRDAVLADDVELPELGLHISELRDTVVSANAYIGADALLPAIERGASVIAAGRAADPSLFVAPIAHELGWALDDWHRLGIATLAGHLLECGAQVTGGNYADPPYRVVPGLHHLGLPYATVSDEGVELSKPPGTGGVVNELCTKLQLLYEVHDPAAYLTPDVTADFSSCEVRATGDDRVLVTGATGRARPDRLKVLVGIVLGWKFVGEISYGGPGCVDRAQLATEMFRESTALWSGDVDEERVDLHGAGALFGRGPAVPPTDVRLRVSARCRTQEAAAALAGEFTFLYFGPAGGGGVSTGVQPFIGVTPAYVARDRVRPEVELATT